VSVSIAEAASKPPAFANKFTLSETLPKASGVLAKSAPKRDKIP